MRQVHKLRGGKKSFPFSQTCTDCSLIALHSSSFRLTAYLKRYLQLSSSHPAPSSLTSSIPFFLFTCTGFPRVSSHLPPDLYTLGILTHILIHVFKIPSYHKMYIQAFMPSGKGKGVSLLRCPFHCCHQLSANELLVTHTYTHLHTGLHLHLRRRLYSEAVMRAVPRA